MDNVISTQDAALLVGVSKATIRNWVKMGYVDSAGRALLSRHSFDSFVRERVGRSKLNNRANKLHKSTQKNGSKKYDLKRWQSYESSLSESHRNREGIYYTPEDIVADIYSKIDVCDVEHATIIDPCCGSGNFLIKALEVGFKPQNIYGYDIDPNAVKITKQRIAELTDGYRSRNIKCADFLEIANSTDRKFDYILTNPPWGRKRDSKSRLKIAKIYSLGRCTDSSALFLSASLKLLKSGGTIGFLLQEALFNIASYKDIRERLFTMKINHFVDYGRRFKSLMTRAGAIIAQDMDHDNQPIICHTGESQFSRSRESFSCNPQLIFNVDRDQEQSEAIMALLKREHATLKSGVKWGLGIVTGDNRRLCRPTPNEGWQAVYRGQDVTLNGFLPPALFIDPDLSHYQQSAPMSLYASPCKIVYRFISSRLCFACDTEQRFILNSANMMLLDDDFPISAQELVKLMNSDFMNWLFSAIFSTHKVLRSNLEELPIFLDCLDNNAIFNEASYLERLQIERRRDGAYRLKQ